MVDFKIKSVRHFQGELKEAEKKLPWWVGRWVLTTESKEQGQLHSRIK